MRLKNLLKSLFVLFFYSCIIKINAQTNSPFNDFPTVQSALNTKNWNGNKSYYSLTKASDSTVHLYWGNNTFKRKYNSDFELSSAEKIYIQWVNKNYLILEYGTGSGAWIDVVLPISKKEKTQEFSNGLYFDTTYNLFVYEGYGDTIVTVQNLQTKKDQFIIDKKHICEAASNNSCIDTIYIKNKILYLNWIIPNNFVDNKKKYNKKIKIKV